MTVFRIHINPTSPADDRRISFEYCLTNRVLGMGWHVPGTEHQTLTWEEYSQAAGDNYGVREIANVRNMHQEVQEGDLIWTRDTEGVYYLARVEARWEYLANEDALEAGIVNIVRCSQIYRLDVDEVPGNVVACFRPPRTFQKIRDRTVSTYSKILWNRYSDTHKYPLEDIEELDIFSLLDDKSTEDAVAIFLQVNGWLFVPGSRKPYTMGYEYILIHRKTRERAVVQVKTGESGLDRNERSKFATGKDLKIILFQSRGIYTGLEHRNVECIDPDELRQFLVESRDLLPASISHWVDESERNAIIRCQ